MDDTAGPTKAIGKVGDSKIATPVGDEPNSRTLKQTPYPQAEHTKVEPDNVVVMDEVATTPESVEEEDTGFDPGLQEVADAGVLCPRCLWDTSLSIVEPTEEDKKEYLRCVLGNRSFEKTYLAFGGAVAITLQERNRELAELREHQQKLNTLKIISETDARMAGLEVLDNATKTRVATLVRKIKLADNERAISHWTNLTEEPDGPSIVEQLNNEVFRDISESMTAVLVQVTKEFESLVDTITQRAMNSDFWTSAGQS